MRASDSPRTSASASTQHTFSGTAFGGSGTDHPADGAGSRGAGAEAGATDTAEDTRPDDTTLPLAESVAAPAGSPSAYPAGTGAVTHDKDSSGLGGGAEGASADSREGREEGEEKDSPGGETRKSSPREPRRGSSGWFTRLAGGIGGGGFFKRFLRKRGNAAEEGAGGAAPGEDGGASGQGVGREDGGMVRGEAILEGRDGGERADSANSAGGRSATSRGVSRLFSLWFWRWCIYRCVRRRAW
jgi:hypothetical protein